ncbi:MAG: xanthine dehydrogenase family protein molybdopterin-binding subunit [Deltaproteobacteria bacterium]|jgi:xanthine dehydrogenase molybdenum-binding subunit|nr:xanthine dehydrogenase family protein molybdopterin-binding subunit [Deltaproteobacteria bacterium]MBW2535839.1 xanthine dehydrogenase family protein molybdopterin-binding subunit [Deltaproteobacteria bacterium]
MSAGRHIGSDSPRPDAPAKAAGRAEYIHDLDRPGMLYGKVKFSEHAHARIRRIDTSKARRLPGVRAVITGYDTPPIRIGFLQDNLALKRDKVRQFRDEIAAVAATDPDIAAEAIDLIEVEYEPLPGVFCPVEAQSPDAPLVHETDPRGKARSSNVLDLRYHHETGDLDAGRRASKHVVEGEFHTPRIQQCCMGTAGCIAEFDLAGNLTIWAKTQIPFLAQRDFNRALGDMGLRGKNARVIVPALGGGFGTGLDTHAYEYIAILLAHAAGKPVKIVYSREEEFAYLSPRQSATTRIEQGCDEHGKLTYRRCEVLLDNGAYTSWGATYPSVMLLPATSLYRVPHVYFDAKLVYTNNTYCQAMRGYGNPEVTWALESNLDELAEQAGIDPVDLRLRNCNEPGETTPMGLKVSTCGLRECLEQTRDKLGWKERRGRGAAKRRGVGIASLVHVGGSGRIYRSDASGIILRLDDFGNVYVSSGGVEMGQGFHSALTLAVADYVGVRPDHVFINQTDTSTCPWDVGTHASRGAFTACNAAKMAADELRQRIFEAAEQVVAKELGKNLTKYQRKHPDHEPPSFDLEGAADRRRFDLRDGVLTIDDAPDEPWARIELGRLLRALHFRDRGQMFTVEALYDPPSELPDWNRGYGNMSATYAYGTQGAEVEVDVETGEVRLLRLVAVHDVGKVLNRQTLEGQTYGALAQGIGYALVEEIQSEQGRIINPDFRDYKIPTAFELGVPMDISFVETDDPFGPSGAKGVGEPGLVPTAPAIANAIYDAIGIRIRDLPMTPEKILGALQEPSPDRAR